MVYLRYIKVLLIAATVGLSSCSLPVVAQAGGYSPELAEQLKRCRSLVSSGRYGEARAELSNIAKSQPNCVDVYEIVGISYLKQGDCRQAEVNLRRAAELNPTNSNILNNLGNALYRQTKLDESIEFYKKALALPNDEPHKILVNLGNSYGDQRKLEDAVDVFNRALQLKPGFAPAYLGLGRMYCDNGKLDMAERELRNAVKYKPDYSSAYYYLGRVQSEKGNYSDAMASLRSSLSYEQNPQYIDDTNRFMREVKAKLADRQRTAAASTSSGSTSSPSFTSVIPPVSTENKDDALDTVKQLLMQRDWQAAERELEQINSRYGKDDPVVWNNLGYARMHQGTRSNKQPYADAIQDYKIAIKLRKGPFPTAQYNLGHAYRLLDSRKYARLAEDAFKQAIEDARSLGSTCPLAQNGLGLVLKQKGDLKGADAAYRRAIAQSGVELPVAHYNLALLLEHSDKTRQAVSEYKAYLGLEPKGYNAERARIRLKRLGVEPPTPRSGG